MLGKIQEIIVDMLTIEPDEVKAEANLRDDLDMSSLDLINLAVELEKEFHVSISNKTIVAAQKVADVIALIENETNKNKAAAAI